MNISGPSVLCGAQDTFWTLGVDDQYLNNVSWDIILEDGTFGSITSGAIDTLMATGYTFQNGFSYDSLQIVVSGNVGTMCTFSDTLPVIFRDTEFDIFGDAIVCDATDSSIYYVNVPGISTISWEVTGGNTIVDTIGADKDSIAVVWSDNGNIIANIQTTDGCTITDTLSVLVRTSSRIVGDTAVSELDTVVYSLKGITTSGAVDFTDLTAIDWTYPSNGVGSILNANMDSVQVVFNNQTGEPFYIDSISVSFVTNDGCTDTITQMIQIRETTYALMGICLLYTSPSPRDA